MHFFGSRPHQPGGEGSILRRRMRPGKGPGDRIVGISYVRIFLFPCPDPALYPWRKVVPPGYPLQPHIFILYDPLPVHPSKKIPAK